MKPKIKLLRGATQAFRIIATQDLSQAQSVRLQLRHSERTFVLNMPFVIDGRSIRFVWYANDQPYLGNYEIRAEADWGEGNVGACDWADVEGIELVDHSYKTRRCNTSTLEVETVELNGDLMQTAMGLSTYQSWLSAGHVGDVDAFLEWSKGPKGEPGTPGVSGGMLFPTMQFDAETGELEISGLEAEVDRISFDEETAELVITL